MARPKLIRIEALSEHFAPVFYREVGERLEFWRKARGLGLIEASRLLRTSSATLSWIERGLRRMGPELSLKEFAEAVGGMDVALWIVLGTGKAPASMAQIQADHKARQAEARAKQWVSRIQKLLDQGYSERYVSTAHPLAWQHFLERKNQTGAVKTGKVKGDQ